MDAATYLAKKLSKTYKHTTPYCLRMNGKNKRWNGVFSAMMTKYTPGRLTPLWDLFIGQALFAARVQLQATMKIDSLSLLYKVWP